MIDASAPTCAHDPASWPPEIAACTITPNTVRVRSSHHSQRGQHRVGAGHRRTRQPDRADRAHAGPRRRRATARSGPRYDPVHQQPDRRGHQHGTRAEIRGRRPGVACRADRTLAPQTQVGDRPRRPPTSTAASATRRRAGARPVTTIGAPAGTRRTAAGGARGRRSAAGWPAQTGRSARPGAHRPGWYRRRGRMDNRQCRPGGQRRYHDAAGADEHPAGELPQAPATRPKQH